MSLGILHLNCCFGEYFSFECRYDVFDIQLRMNRNKAETLGYLLYIVCIKRCMLYCNSLQFMSYFTLEWLFSPLSIK